MLLGVPIAHQAPLLHPLALFGRDFSSSRFPRRLARVHKKSHVCMCACMCGAHAYTVVYIRGGGREVTRQGFNGILFTGFVPWLGKHSGPMPTSLWMTILLRILLYIGLPQKRRYLRDGFLSCILGRVFLRGKVSREITAPLF